MSLQVWLPLNGNLKQQGVSDVQLVASNTTIENAGKIGACYSFNGTSSQISLQNLNLQGWAELSISCWIYPQAENWYLFLARGNNQHRVNVNQSGFIFRDSKNSSSYRTIAWASAMPLNTWTHIVATYSHGHVCLYRNGILEVTSSTYYNSSSTLLASNTDVRIGRQQSTSSNAYLLGKLNDFRLYDHCLSAAEVREIAQGLVLHYKLDTYNLFNPNTLIQDIYLLSNGNTSTSGAVGNWALTEYIPVKPNTTYIGYNLVNGGNGNPSICYYDINKTYTRGAAITANTPLNITTQNNEYYVRISIRKINNDIYKMSFFEIPKIIEDSSGYNYNGTITGNIMAISDTPRYSSSSTFNGTERITTASPGADICTLSCWCKTTKNKSTSQHMVADSGSHMCISFYQGNIIGVFGTTRSTGSKSILGESYKENDWNHIVVIKTNDSGARDIYCNGVKLTPAANDFWSAASGFFVGARNASNGLAFYGQISDVRAYCTALSADDVLALYHTGAKIDNKQNLHCYEAEENKSKIAITKQGNIFCNELNEVSATKFYNADKLIETNQIIEP